MAVAFTDRELDIMAVLWDRGPSTVSEVRPHLKQRLAYTTVLTMLRILEEKGFVDHVEEGRAHRYHPLIERREAGNGALARVVTKIFGGSPELMVTELASGRGVSAAELKFLRRFLADRLGRKGEK